MLSTGKILIRYHFCTNIFATIIILLIFLVPEVHCNGNSKLDLFDNIITKELSIGDQIGEYRFSSSTKSDIDTKHYIFDYQFKKVDPYHHYTCTVSAAEAGKFINPQQYQKEYDQLKKEYMESNPDRWKQQLLVEYPDIGLRSLWGHTFAGPGGASFELVFTTSDGKYDIKTLLSNLMPDKVESPDLKLEQIAETISKNYNKSSNTN